MSEAETSRLNLEHLLELTFSEPPPGLEMFGPGCFVSMQESEGTHSKDCDEHASISECSTANAVEAAESSLAGSDYYPGDALKMSAQMSTGGAKPSTHRRQLIRLQNALPEEACGSPGFPSIGSVGHHLGICKPCDFVYRGDGCRAGSKCQYCHLCPRGELRRRKAEKKFARMMMRTTAVKVWP